MHERLRKALSALHEIGGSWKEVVRLCLKTARTHISMPVLIGVAALVGVLIVIQGFAATQLSTDALSTTESTLYRHVALPLAEKFRMYSERFTQSEVQMRLNEVASINPHVRLYLVNERGIVTYAPHRYGKVLMPFITLAPVHQILSGGIKEHEAIYGDDPSDPRAKVPFSVATLRLAGDPYYLYVVTSSGSLQNYFERAAGLRLGLSSFAMALLSTAIIVAVAFLLMYRKLKAVSTSLAVLSHDLRGPLTSIQSSLESMAEKGIGENSRELKVALRSAKSATAMLNDLHHLSKIQATDDEIEMEPLALADLLMDCVMAVKPTADEKQLDLTLAIPHHLPLVYGNLELIERMARNLIDNAIRYTPPGGRIDVSVAQLHEILRVTVHDTGVGIPAEQLSRVSERFVRGGNVKRSIQGSGIGLSVASEVARLHGGPLKILSKEGEGTAIVFDLPVWRHSTTEHPSP
jgi:signal transduction histidine kinase